MASLREIPLRTWLLVGAFGLMGLGLAIELWDRFGRGGGVLGREGEEGTPASNAVARAVEKFAGER